MVSGKDWVGMVVDETNVHGPFILTVLGTSNFQLTF